MILQLSYRYINVFSMRLDRKGREKVRMKIKLLCNGALLFVVAVVQSLSCVWLFETPWTVERQASLSFTISQSLLNLMSIESVMPSNNPSLILCCPRLLPPSLFPSIRVFSNESVLHIKWKKHWSFSFSICPSNEYSGLVSFRNDWFDLLAVPLISKGLSKVFFSPASQLKSINSLALSLLCGTTLTSVHDY